MNYKIPSCILAAALCFCISACGETATVALSNTAEPTQKTLKIDNSNAVTITLSDGASTASGAGVDIDNDTVTITSGGNYVLTGTLNDGQIIIQAGDDADVTLTLAGASIRCSDSAAIYVPESGDVTINLENDTENLLAVTGDYIQTDDNTVDAALFSKSDLTFTGGGTLEIDAEYGHGIVTKDDLVIVGGAYTIQAESHGISGKDSVTISDGQFAITCGQDAIHASNNEDDGLGWVSISGGAFSIAAGDDGIHAETALTITGGAIAITESYEGLEGKSVTIEDGTISVVSSDDGINAAGGDGSSGWGDFTSDESCFIRISGGELSVNASGDGLDANGTIDISGGVTYISGPTDNGNGALDYSSEGTITGGIVMAAGSSGMAMNFGETGTQGSILYCFDSQQAAGTNVTLEDASGNVIAEYAPEKAYQCVVISAPEITADGTYTLAVGAESYQIMMSGLLYGTGGMGGMGGRGQRPGGMTENTIPEGGGEWPQGEQPSGRMPEDGQFPKEEMPSAPANNAVTA